MKKLINYIKSLGWDKEDVKKILMLIIMLLIACFILNNLLVVKVRIKQKYRSHKFSDAEERIIHIVP